MAGLKRVLGLRRVLGSGAVTCVVLSTGACDLGEDTAPGAGGASQGVFVDGSGQNQGGFAGGVAFAGSGAIINIPSTGGAVGTFVPPCVLPPSTDPVFKSQALISRLPAVREFYSWTTDEQAAALRTDQVLFSKSEQADAGPGYAFTYLSQFVSSASDPDQQDQEVQLAAVLTGDLFAKKRYAWSEPWSTRMGWPGEDYGNNLLRIVLKPEAWLVVVDNGQFMVLDLDNMQVAISDALASPERIGAILFVKASAAGGPICNGSFTNGANGYREFILGNLGMVEEWSLGTQQIRDRLQSNISDLTRFFGLMRDCPVVLSAQQWNAQAVCSWNEELDGTNEIFTYEQSLAIPSEYYIPEPAQIAALIETLQGDLFEPDPLIVNPGSP